MKKLVKFLVVCSAIVLGLVAWVAVDMFSTSTEDENSKTLTSDEPLSAEEEKDREAVAGEVSEQELNKFNDSGLNPFGEDIPQFNLSAMDIEDYIHGMSHQKVDAMEKWGFYEIHPERIEWLLEGLDKTDHDLLHKQVYKGILEKWSEGDFTQIDHDHNKIWELQGGSIGKAHGILSPEEEKEYIESQ